MHIAHALLIILLAVSAGSARAESPKSVEEIFDFSAAKMAEYKTWSANMSQTMKMFGGQMTTEGEITHKLPRQMRMRMNMPMLGQDVKMNMTMVMGVDGIMWQEMNMGGMKRVIKMDMNKAMSNLMVQTGMKIDPLQAMDPSQQWKASKEMFDYSQAGTETIHGQPMYVIEGTWKPAARTNQQVAAMAAFTGKTRLYIGQQDGFVHKMEQFDRSNTNLFMTMELTNLKFNGELPDETFVYKPADGLQVMDMTEMAGAMIAGKGMQPAAPPAPLPPAPAQPEPTQPAPAQ